MSLGAFQALSLGDGSVSANSAFAGLRLVANNMRLPSQLNTGFSTVLNSWTKHRSGPSGFPNGVYASFVNGYIATNQESNAFYDFNLITGIYVNGKFTQGIFVGSGSSTVTLAKEWGKDTAFYNVAIPPNTDFWVTNRRVPVDQPTANIAVTGYTLTNPVVVSTAGHSYLAGQVVQIKDVLLAQTGTVTGATVANPCVITSVGHGLSTGMGVQFANVGGMASVNWATNGNRSFKITVIDANSFSLDGLSTFGTGPYTSGGTWTRLSQINSFMTGNNYTVASPTATEFTLTATDGTTWTAFGSGGNADRQYTVLSSHAGQGFRQDGVIGTSSLSDNFTLGSGIAYGGKLLAPIMNASGVITSIPIDPNNRGANYTSGWQVAFYFGGAQINTTGALYEGTTAWGGYGNSSGGVISSVTTTGGGAGFNPNNPPIVIVGGSGTAGSGFGTATASYGPFAIFGENDAPILSVLNIGDSIMAGYGSVDGLGDISGNFGIYERSYQNRCGVMTFAVSGTSAAGFLANDTRQLETLRYLKGLGLVIDKFVVGLGVNDFNSNANSNVLSAVQTNVSEIITQINAIYPNADGITTTIPPLTTTTDGGVTTANQTVWSVGFGGTPNYSATGFVFQYNNAIRNGTGIAGQKGFIDTAFCFADPTVPSKWRVAGEFYLSSASGIVMANPETVGATPNTMIHPSLNIGIPYAAANLDLSQLLQPVSTRNIEPLRDTYIARPYEQGEFLYRRLAAASAVSLTTATAANVISIVLPAGDWEVSGSIAYVAASATCTNVTGSTSRISATQGREEATASRIMTITTTSGTERIALPVTPYRVQSNATMTVFLVATATFSAGTMTAYGTITAKRM